MSPFCRLAPLHRWLGDLALMTTHGIEQLAKLQNDLWLQFGYALLRGFLPFNQTSLFKDIEMAGYGGLSERKQGRELGYRLLALRQSLNDGVARHVPEAANCLVMVC